MLRVTIGSLRERRTRAATPWHTKCAAQHPSTATSSSAAYGSGRSASSRTRPPRSSPSRSSLPDGVVQLRPAQAAGQGAAAAQQPRLGQQPERGAADDECRVGEQDAQQLEHVADGQQPQDGATDPPPPGPTAGGRARQRSTSRP